MLFALLAAAGMALLLHATRSRKVASDDWLKTLVVPSADRLQSAPRRAPQATLRSTLERLGAQIRAAVGVRSNSSLQRRLEWVGWSITPEGFLAGQLLSAAAGLLVCLAAALALGSSGIAPFIGIGGAAAGWFLPSEALDQQYRSARARLGREALGYGDFLIAAVRAGHPLERALIRLGADMQGRLPVAMARAAEESIQTKESADLTLETMAAELNDPSVTAIVGAIIQARSVGGDLAGPLSGLITALRQERQQKMRTAARGRAATSSLPLVLVMIPGLMAPIGYLALSAMRGAGF